MRMTKFFVYKIKITGQIPRGCKEIPFDDIA